MVGVDLIAPLRDAVVPRRDRGGKDARRVVLVERDEHQWLVGAGRGLALDGDDARLRGFNLEECAVGGKGSKRLLLGEFGDERLGSAVGGWHLRGQQACVACMPRPCDVSIVGRTQRDDDTIEGDSGAVVAAVGRCGSPFRHRRVAKADVAILVDHIGHHIEGTGKGLRALYHGIGRMLCVPVVEVDQAAADGQIGIFVLDGHRVERTAGVVAIVEGRGDVLPGDALPT